MLWPAICFFSTYWALHVYDEWYFHRRRRIPVRERCWRLLNTILVLSAIGYALFFENSTATSLGFWSLASLSLMAFPFMESDMRSEVTAPERFVHSILSMLHPLMLVLLLVIWKFIDGAGFFMNLVLPFSTKNLRPVCQGYLTAMAAFFLLQVALMALALRRDRAAAALPASEARVEATEPAETVNLNL